MSSYRWDLTGFYPKALIFSVCSFKVESRMSVNNKDILQVQVGFNWLLPQSFDL